MRYETVIYREINRLTRQLKAINTHCGNVINPMKERDQVRPHG